MLQTIKQNPEIKEAAKFLKENGNGLSMKLENKWDEIDEKLQFIHRNLDICCQDLCEGQESKHKLEEVMQLLVDIRESK